MLSHYVLTSFGRTFSNENFQGIMGPYPFIDNVICNSFFEVGNKDYLGVVILLGAGYF